MSMMKIGYIFLDLSRKNVSYIVVYSSMSVSILHTRIEVVESVCAKLDRKTKAVSTKPELSVFCLFFKNSSTKTNLATIFQVLSSLNLLPVTIPKYNRLL